MGKQLVLLLKVNFVKVATVSQMKYYSNATISSYYFNDVRHTCAKFCSMSSRKALKWNREIIIVLIFNNLYWGLCARFLRYLIPFFRVFVLVSASDLFTSSLTHFSPMFHFYTPWKCKETKGFLAVSGGIEMEHQGKMGCFSDVFQGT